MQNTTDGDSSRANITVPTVPGLSVSTVELIYRTMRRRGERGGHTGGIVKAFYLLPEGGAMTFELPIAPGSALTWCYGERPPLVEVIRDIGELKGKIVHSEMKTP